MTHSQLHEKITALGYKGFLESYKMQSEDIAYTKMLLLLLIVPFFNLFHRPYGHICLSFLLNILPLQ
jgi:hypothetical protein